MLVRPGRPGDLAIGDIAYQHVHERVLVFGQPATRPARGARTAWPPAGADPSGSGQHYGTLLIDRETSAPLDLLQGRDAQPLADWLAAHCHDGQAVAWRRP